MTFQVSPGVYVVENDFSITNRVISPSIASVVGPFERGSTSLTYVTNQTDLTRRFGKPSLDYGYAGFGAFHFLDVGNQLWVRRVVGSGAQYGVGFFANDWTAASTWKQTSWNPINAGETNPYSGAQRQVQDIVFAGDFVTANAISVTVNGGSPATVNFTTSSNNTMTLLAAAIQAKIDAIATGGSATVVSFSTGNNRIIRIISPINTTLTFTAISVTGGAGQTTGQVRNTDILFWVYSENPGAWANNIFLKLTNLDPGYTQRLTLTISAAFVASNVINGTINGVAITPVTYATDSDTTLAALAASIQTTLNGIATGGSATVVTVTGGTTNDRQIQIVAPSSAYGLTFAGFAVTAGASQPTITVAETQKQIVSNGTFRLSVYEYPNVNQPAEQWTVSLKDSYVDGFGNQLNLDYQVNTGPNKSSLIRTVVNTALAETSRNLLNLFSSTGIPGASSIPYLVGAADGVAVTSNDVINGWNSFTDPETVTIRLMINGGWSIPAVQQKMILVAQSRHDCFAILDVPSNMQASQDAANYRTQQMNIDSSYGALYTPDVLVNDENTGQAIYVPPSGLIAARYAYTDKVFAEWGAPAGMSRGIIPRALQLRVAYNEGDRDLLSPIQVNTIRKIGPTITIWGEYTLQTAMSDLSSVGVRRMMITIETTLAQTVAYSVFEPNDEPTRRAIRSVCEDFLSLIKQGRGLNDYLVVCDDSNNTPATIDARVVNVWVFLKPTTAALYIKIDAVLTKESSTFSESQQRLSNSIN